MLFVQERPAAVFVDLPNLYSCLLRSGLSKPRILRDYFINWLDIDLMARALCPSYSGVWVFYSGERIGPSSERIEGEYLRNYIRRINSQEGVTARNVNIPGEQREPISIQCPICGEATNAEHRSEKGIDASLTVHLFDTMDSWDTAYLLSADADFVPAVTSLRRRGKTIVAAGFPDSASEALVRECYFYGDLSTLFIRQDFALYCIFREEGIAHRWLSDEIQPESPTPPRNNIELEVQWDVTSGREPTETYELTFRADGPLDVSSRQQMLESALTGSRLTWDTCQNHRQSLRTWTIHVPELPSEAFRRRLEAITSHLQPYAGKHPGEYYSLYQYDPATERHQPHVPLHKSP
jgi:uncharacterized LabA/DUF88 family protein